VTTRPTPPSVVNTSHPLYSLIHGLYVVDADADLTDITGHGYPDLVRYPGSGSPPFSTSGPLGPHFNSDSSSNGVYNPNTVIGQLTHIPYFMGGVFTRSTTKTGGIEEAVAGLYTSTNNGTSNDTWVGAIISDGTNGGTLGQLSVKCRTLAAGTIEFAPGPNVQVDDNTQHAWLALVQSSGGASVNVDLWVDSSHSFISWTANTSVDAGALDQFRFALGSTGLLSDASLEAAMMFYGFGTPSGPDCAAFAADPWTLLVQPAGTAQPWAPWPQLAPLMAQ
jgi:hypothetical protein